MAKTKRANKKEVKNSDYDEYRIDFKKVFEGKSNILIPAAIVIVIVLLLAGAYWYTQSVNHFKFAGITFDRSYTGEILFYTANVPVIDKQGQIVSYAKIDFRNDPRVLEDIPSNVGNFVFISNKEVYISFEDTNKTFLNGAVAAANLGRFLSTIGLKPKSAINSSAYLNNSALPYVNCNTNKNNTVIMMQEAKTSSIGRNSLNCYTINYNEAEIVQAIERFELAILQEFMNNFA